VAGWGVDMPRRKTSEKVPSPSGGLPEPGVKVKWFLEMGPDGQFVPKFLPVQSGEEVDDIGCDDRGPDGKGEELGSNCVVVGNNSVEGPGVSLGGRSMTMWWLKLSAVTALNGSLLLHLFPDSVSLHRVVSAFRGCSAASGVCVGVGYYMFALMMALTRRQPSLFYQLYRSTGLSSSISFPNYMTLDFAVHLVATTSVYLIWKDAVAADTTGSVVLAYSFHRWWSLWHSGFQSPFFRGDQVYLLPKPLPWWMWDASYLVEFLVLLALWSVKHI